MPTSILHSLSTFLSRRYNLNSTPSDRDRESLARDVASNLKHIPITTITSAQSPQQQLHIDGTASSIEDGNVNYCQLLETTLKELEQTLAACEVSLDQFEMKERFLYLRIERYRQMIRERELFITTGIVVQERERDEDIMKKKGSSDDNDDDDGNIIIIASGEEENNDEEKEMDAQEDNDLENNDTTTNTTNNNNNQKNLTQEQIIQLTHKHQQDQTNLQDVETLHAEIIVQIETLKRRIIELEEKQQDIVKKRDECYEFLVEFAERDL
mmetsp:Transcript_13272/g.21782  ORF Transcript_13272/g.21782 Transcript_13272/m.21782 type:complete len:269 (-) Transcript_13272:43-849(-)